MTGILQTVKPVAASNNAPTPSIKKKTGNKQISPINTGGPVESPLMRTLGGGGGPVEVGEGLMRAIRGRPPIDTPGPVERDWEQWKKKLEGDPNSTEPVMTGGPTPGSGFGDQIIDRPLNSFNPPSYPGAIDGRAGPYIPGPGDLVDLPEVRPGGPSGPVPPVISDPKDAFKDPEEPVTGGPTPGEPTVDSIERTETPQNKSNPIGAPVRKVGNIQQPGVEKGDYRSIEQPEVTAEEMRDSASVENRLNGLLSSDSKYIKEARRRAAEKAAASGMRNSTLGMAAGERAAIQSAMPIAQQDAQQDFQLQRDANQAQLKMDQGLYQALLQGERDAVMQQYGLDQKQYESLVQEARDQNLAQYQQDRDVNQNNMAMTRDRFQADLQSERDQLLYQQQLGTMDKQQEMRLEELNTQADLTERRDQLLQELQSDTMTQQHAQQLELMQEEFENKMMGMSAEMDHQNRLNYANAANQAQIAALEQIGMMYQNQNMNPEQQRNAVRGIYDRLEQTYRSLESVYGNLPGVDLPERGTDGVDDDANSGRPGGGRDTIVRPPGGGGGRPGRGGGAIRRYGGGGPATERRLVQRMR